MLFAVFAAHHSICARESIKAWISRRVPDRLMRSVYVWTASLLLVLVVLAWRPIGGDLYHATGWPRSGHAGVQLAGVWLIARSVRAIDALELAGIRSSGGSASLQIAGPYRLVRHPLYLGWMLIVFGAAHMTGDRVAFAAVTTIYLVIAMPWEERSLERTFGDEYARYKQRVRWRIIPYVYSVAKLHLRPPSHGPQARTANLRDSSYNPETHGDRSGAHLPERASRPRAARNRRVSADAAAAGDHAAAVDRIGQPRARRRSAAVPHAADRRTATSRSRTT